MLQITESLILSINALHPVSFSCEDVNDESPILRLPRFVFWVRINDGRDILLDVIFLSAFVIQGNRAKN